ncbi:MAG TPA: microviridin/marinostatin family tricyclic proteinase inhibitor [Pyrinomonadaceae bacterium]|nr:microviridin/marinostatin family tricyclic proteinase inhibitor [Pyrinomonadaceae bacterium]
MKGREQKDSAVPTPDAAATPFFARFLEDQYGGGAEAKAAARIRSLKYPSDRDEDIDPYAPAHVEAAPTNVGPSRMTLKYPSDRDEIDFYVEPYGNAAHS